MSSPPPPHPPPPPPPDTAAAALLSLPTAVSPPPPTAIPIPFVVPPTTSLISAPPAAPSAAVAAAPPRPLPNFLPNPNSNQPEQHILYPLASSGRGFIPYKPPLTPSQHIVTIASPNRAAMAPAPKASSKSHANGLADTRDRSCKDGNLIVVRDRKVRLSDGDSLYALGRSWLRNGFHKEQMVWRTQFGDFPKTLPRPLPVTVPESPTPKEGDEEENEVMDVEGLSAKDLLKGHILHAKRVRMRAKEERMKRISRFKKRIRMLLPTPEVEQFRSDSASGI